MNLVDKLLNVDKEEARKEITGTYDSKRMKRLVGDGTIEIRALKERTVKRYATMGVDKKGNIEPEGFMDAILMTVVDGCKNPDLKNEELQKHFGAETPKDLAEILFDGELEDMSTAIVELMEIEDETNEVKN